VSTKKYVAESCFEFLHLELVEYFRNQCRIGVNAEQTVINPLSASVIPSTNTTNSSSVSSASTISSTSTSISQNISGSVSGSGEEKKAKERAERESQSKIEEIGFQVGLRLAEKYSREVGWFVDQLDIIKFICKDFWIAVFRKQIDKLQTNYKGIWVLHDNQFRWLFRLDVPLVSSSTGHFSLPNTGSANVTPTSMSSSSSLTQSVSQSQTVNQPGNSLIEEAKFYTAFACGLIRGGLWNLGIHASVKADVNKLPACQFTVVDLKKKKATKV